MYKVLVADDEPIELQFVYNKLSSFFDGQIEIFLAENGCQAVALFNDKHCDIAILDIEMPGMSGLDAADIIRSADSNCSIIFLTAFDEFNYARKAIGVKALEYLLKPASDEDLINTLEDAFSICDRNMKGSQGREGRCDEMPLAESRDFSRTGEVVREAREFIDAHFKEDISLQDVARSVGYSDVYFCKLFKQGFGKSFIVYLNEFRIEKAKKMLANPSINVKDISAEAGYRDANYFTRVFKRMTGTTPTEYRNNVLAGAENE